MEIREVRTVEEVDTLIAMVVDYVATSEIDTALSPVDYAEIVRLSLPQLAYKCFVATLGGEFVGFITARHNYHKKELWVEDFYVKPSFRGRRIGKALAWTLSSVYGPTTIERVYFKSLSRPLKFWLRLLKGIKVKKVPLFYFTRKEYEDAFKG